MKSKSKSDYKILIADRGNLQFEYPRKWKCTPKEGGIIRLEDPQEDCALEVSYLTLPKVDIPLPSPREQMTWLIEKDNLQVDESDIEVSELNGQQCASVEYFYDDAKEHRQARALVAIVSNGRFQALVTFYYWPEHYLRFRPAAQRMLDSLVLGDGFQFASPRQALELLAGPKN